MPFKRLALKTTPALRFLIVVFILAIFVVSALATRTEKPAPAGTSKALYRDPKAPLEDRVEDLLSRMTVAEKIGQMAMVERKYVFDRGDIARYGIGALVSGGGSNPAPNTPRSWLDMVNGYQTDALGSRLGIPLLYGVDGIHGHANVPGATVFPHFIGLGASRDADLVRRVARATTDEMAATGVYWNFSPNLDVPKDMRWGRVFESFGSDTDAVSGLGRAYLEGIAGSADGGAIGAAKHYVGNGAASWGTSADENYRIDQGASEIDEATLRREHLPPFKAAVEAGATSVMIGLNSWNGVKLSANRYLLTDVLKGELGFDGFTVSDWYGVYEIPGGEYHATVTAIEAGLDMLMLPFDYKSFVGYVEQALKNGDLTQARVDDAVRRILRAKFRAGLFDRPLPDASRLSRVGSEEHRALAREAVRKSTVLLKNAGRALPIRKDAARIVVAGSAAHNLGRQCGGWTVEWQGIDGNWIPGTTILDGIRDAASGSAEIAYDLDGNFAPARPLADVGIAVVGEKPYAEGFGDSEHPALTPEDLATIAKVRKASKKLVVVIVSGRPLDIRPYAKDWDAVVAAWLPGTEGGGVADVLFGKYPFTGKLPVAWEL